MKKINLISSLLLSTFLILSSCSNDDDNLKEQIPASVIVEATEIKTSTYSNGIYGLTDDNKIDFISANGNLETAIYTKNNNGEGIPNSEVIREVIPFEKGYIIATFPVSQQGNSKLYFTDLDFKLQTIKEIKRVNVSTGSYAIIGTKLYYTNVASPLSFADEDNGAYIIDLETKEIQEFPKKRVLKYVSDSNGNLYALDVATTIYKIDKTNLNDIEKLQECNNYLIDIIVDKNDVIWGKYHNKDGASVFELINNTVYRPINIIRYDLKTNKFTDTETPNQYNLLSNLGLSKDKNEVYLIATNREKNTKTFNKLNHSNSKNELQNLFSIKSEPFYEYIEDEIYAETSNKVMVFGKTWTNEEIMYKVNPNTKTTATIPYKDYKIVFYPFKK